MTTIISGSAQNITFSDGTTQTTAALPLTGGQLSGNMTFSTGTNGIVFNNSSALTNSTLNDYETGTWTPTDASGAGLIFTLGSCVYTKIGNMVYCSGVINYPSNSNTAAASFTVPFTSVALANNVYGGFVPYSNTGLNINVFITGTNATSFYPPGSNVQTKNNALSGTQIRVVLIYQANF